MGGFAYFRRNNRNLLRISARNDADALVENLFEVNMLWRAHKLCQIAMAIASVGLNPRPLPRKRPGRNLVPTFLDPLDNGCQYIRGQLSETNSMRKM